MAVNETIFTKSKINKKSREKRYNSSTTIDERKNEINHERYHQFSKIAYFHQSKYEFSEKFK